MSYAAKYPENIAALVVEDMDIRERPMSMNGFHRKDQNREATVSFDRNLNVNSIEEVYNIFETEGYPRDAIDKWIKEGRIFDRDDISGDQIPNFVSEVNPAFRLLCYEQFFITDHGETTWRQIASNQHFSFPCHIMVAGTQGTVCDNYSILKMQQIMKKHNDFRMILHRYNFANHSIHNSAKKEFLKDLRNIIDNA